MKKIYSSPQATIISDEMEQNLLEGSLPVGESYDPDKGYPQTSHELEFDEDEEIW